MKYDYLFVYGTLLKENDNAMSKFLQRHSQCVGKGFFQGKLYKISWYPGAVLSVNKADRVYGSIFKFNDGQTVFKVLDNYEGVDQNLFKRVLVDTFLDDKTVVTSWVYLYNLSISHLKQIDSGDFLKFSVDKF